MTDAIAALGNLVNFDNKMREEALGDFYKSGSMILWCSINGLVFKLCQFSKKP